MPTPVQLRGDPILRRLSKHGPVVVVEVGIFVGRLSTYLLRHRRDLFLIGVDNWLPEEQQPEAYCATGDRHARQSLDECRRCRKYAYSRLLPYRDRVEIYDLDSSLAAKLVDNASCGLVFLDGDHSESGVMADLKAWVPKVAPGGWIAGHDFRHADPKYAGVTAAVEKWAAGRPIELDTDTTWFCRL